MSKVMEQIANEVEVGTGAHVAGYSDIAPYTIIAVRGCTITAREDEGTLLNGVGSGEPDALQFALGGFCGHTSGTQRYSIRPNPSGWVRAFSLRNNGEYVEVGTSTKSGPRFQIGQRLKYHDFNF